MINIPSPLLTHFHSFTAFIFVLIFLPPQVSIAQQTPSIQLGEATWGTFDLNTQHFNNGDPIPHAETAEDWVNAHESYIPAWCYPKDELGAIDSSRTLYNIHAINDVRGIAPVGWRIAKVGDWYQLIERFGGSHPTPRPVNIDSIYTELENLMSAFERTTDHSEFIRQHGIETDFEDDIIFTLNPMADYQPEVPFGSELRTMNVINLNINDVFGPFTHGDYLSIGKIIAMENVKMASARHILLIDSEQENRKKLNKQADKIIKEIRKKGNFREMVTSHSDDPGSIDNGGEYLHFTEGIMVKEFNDFCFNEPIGKIGRIETAYGVHIVEVLDRSENVFPKIALVNKPNATYSSAASYLKSATGWMFDGNGTHTIGFDAVPVSIRLENGEYAEYGLFSAHWADGLINDFPAAVLILYDDFIYPVPMEEGIGCLVRCVKE